MKVLIACEYSGVVREAFAKKGHKVMSCDLDPTDVPGNHYQGNVFDIINEGWDLMIAHPPCTYLTVTGNSWFLPKYESRYPTRKQDRENAVQFFMALANAPIAKIAIENPVGIMSTRWRKADQYIHPYYFGDPQGKKTGLWLKNLPKLVPTDIVEPIYILDGNGRRDPEWHTVSRSMPPKERMKFRSRTFQGIADAMADQWG